MTDILAGAKVETYQLVTATGLPIRKATKVVLVDGREIRFVERTSKRDALKNAAHQIARGHLNER